MTPRKYDRTRRAEQSAETRQRIIAVVVDQLREGPGRPLSLDQVAKDTGVARSTLYLIFGSRAGLIQAVAEAVAAQSGVGAIVEAEAQPDARETLRRGIAAGVRMFDADRPVFVALQALSQLNPQTLPDADPLMQENRGLGMATLTARLEEQGQLAVPVGEAADILFVITGFESYDLLRTGRGLGVDQVIERLVTMAERAVLKV